MSASEIGSIRRLGLGTATCLVVANMIGVGVFTTSGFTLDDLGTPERVLAAWVVGGAIAVLGALCYGALAARLSESGGEYLFLSATIHPAAGFLAGWVSLLAGFTAPIALAALAFGAYLAPDLPPGVVGTAVIAVAGLLHGLRLSYGVHAQNTIVAIKLVLLLALIAYGLPRLPELPAQAAVPALSLPAFAAALVWISLSYSGWNAAVYIGGEVRDPARNLPRSLLFGTLITTGFYLLLNAVFVYAAPIAELRGEQAIAAAAARALGGDPLETLVRATVAIALFTSVSAMVMAGPRVYARMAEDGLFPRAFSMRREVPTSAIGLQCALAIVVVWVTTLKDLLGYIGFTLSLSTAVTVCGLLVLRHREGPERVPIPGHPFVPIAFVLTTIGAGGFLLAQKPQAPLAGLATIASGAVLYLIARRPRSG